METKMVPVSRLIQYEVINSRNEDMGQVQNIILDVAEGKIAFVVVAFGGILGISDKWFALPWEIVKWSPLNKKFVINMPREVLKNAPGLDKDKWPEEINISWLRSCYNHYGCTPYWESPVVTQEHIRKLAYSIWESEGRPEGKELDHYYRAEQMLKEQASAVQTPGELVSIKPLKKVTRK